MKGSFSFFKCCLNAFYYVFFSFPFHYFALFIHHNSKYFVRFYLVYLKLEYKIFKLQNLPPFTAPVYINLKTYY